MVYLGNFLGFLAIALFVLSYQLKKRRSIVICNTVSRVFYVLQYLCLGAWTGAVMDSLATLISAILTNREGRGKRLRFAAVFFLYGLIVLSSVLLYTSVYSVVSLIGVSFEVFSFFFIKERNIRMLSLLGQPFWLAYNRHYKAWSSVVGNAITIVSIIVALIRYDVFKKGERKSWQTSER